MNTYIGMFSYESENGDTGQFEVYVKTTSIHRAEQLFRKEIEEFLQKNELITYPTTIFILDIIEIPGDTSSLIFNLSKINKENSGIVFISLPFKRANAVAYSISEPAARELFLVKE